MKLENLIKIAGISVAIVSLAACAKKHPTNIYGSDAARQNAGSQTYGMKDENGYQLDSSGRRINPLTAPANNTYYFALNSNTVQSSDYPAMNIQADYLASHPNAKVRLEGNTDNRGSREYNIGLGWRRAQAVEAYFEQRGVRRDQMELVSYGKERPTAMSVSLGNNNEQAWSLNRRVDLNYKGQ